MRVEVLESVMAKKKVESPPKKAAVPARKGRPPSTEGIRDQAVVVRGRIAWKAWIDELADFARMDVSDMVDQALVEYARAKNFDKMPPKR